MRDSLPNKLIDDDVLYVKIRLSVYSHIDLLYTLERTLSYARIESSNLDTRGAQKTYICIMAFPAVATIQSPFFSVFVHPPPGSSLCTMCIFLPGRVQLKIFSDIILNPFAAETKLF